MLGLGSILGTGFFFSVGLAAGAAGPVVVIAIAPAAGLATCDALSSTQVAAGHTVGGGTYQYGCRLLHPTLGPGGAQPICYPNEISDEQVDQYRRRHGL